MSKRPTANHPEPTTGQVYLRVAEMARLRGVVTRQGPLHDHPNLPAIMRGTGLSYQTVYELLRQPWRIRRIDLATLERLAIFFGCEPGELLSMDWHGEPHPREHTESVNPLAKEWQATRPGWEQSMRAQRGGQRPDTGRHTTDATARDLGSAFTSWHAVTRGDRAPHYYLKYET